MQKTALKVASAIFLAIAIAHLLRILSVIQVTINGFVLPLQFSIIAALVTLTLSVWMFRLSYK